MRMNFEVEIFSHNLAFILVKGIRRGFVGKVPNNPAPKKWVGQLEGNKSELKVSGADLNELTFNGIIYKYNDPAKRKSPILQIYC